MKSKKLLVLFIGVLLVAACVPAKEDNPSKNSERTLSVNGTGIVSLTPDMATITIGVSTNNINAQTAVAQNNSQVEKIMDMMAKMGVAEKDIKTTNFNVYPRNKYDDEGNITSVTYMVSNSVRVNIMDLDLFGEILNEAVKAGANSINGISFDVSDRETAYQQALTVAMENARERAEILAEAAGAELGDVHTVSTFIGGGGEVYPVERAVMMADESSVPIAAGGMDIQVQVSVVFEIN